MATIDEWDGEILKMGSDTMLDVNDAFEVLEKKFPKLFEEFYGLDSVRMMVRLRSQACMRTPTCTRRVE